MKVRILLFLLLMVGGIQMVAQKNYELQSPDKKMQTHLFIGENIQFSLSNEDINLLAPSPVSMTLEGGEVLGANPQVLKVLKGSVDKTIPSPFYKKSEVSDEYNEMTIFFKGDYSLVFRLYNDGLAYRFVTRKKGEIIVVNEEVSYNFPANHRTFAAYANSKADTFEKQFF